MSGSGEELLRALGAPCQALGVELDDVELRSGVLRVTVDRSGGLDLDALAEVARALSSFLDEHDELAPADRYELEVSTPGVERRLRRPEQFRRALGARVALRTLAGSPGARRAEGVLRVADGEGVALELGDGEVRRLAYGEIERARTVFDWQAELSARRAEEKAAKAPSGAGAPERARAASGRAGERPARGRQQATGEEHETRERAARP